MNNIQRVSLGFSIGVLFIGTFFITASVVRADDAAAPADVPATIADVSADTPPPTDTSVDTPAATPPDQSDSSTTSTDTSSTLDTSTTTPTPSDAPANSSSTNSVTTSTDDTSSTTSDESSTSTDTLLTAPIDASTTTTDTEQTSTTLDTPVLVPQLTTDQSDYAPGSLVTIFGKFFQSMQNVLLSIVGSDQNGNVLHTGNWAITAGADGAFTTTYQLPNQFVPLYLVAASSQDGQQLAETSFTDSETLDSVGVGSQSPASIAPGGSATYTVTVGFSKSGGNAICTADLTISGLPTGASLGSFSPATLTQSNSSTDLTSTLTINTTGSIAAGSPSFTVTATGHVTTDCAGTVKTGTGSLVVSKTSTTASVASSANPSTYGDSVTFTATITRGGGSNTPTGTVDIKEGLTVLCTTGSLSGSASAPTASCSTSALSAAASPHSITAVYAGDTNFTGNTSSPLSQVVNKKNLTATITAADKTYDKTNTASITNCLLTGVVGSDIVNCSASAATFASVNASAIAQAVTATVALGGASAGNYTVTSPAATTAKINARAITVTAAANTKTYDTTTSASAAPTVTAGSIVVGDNGSFTESYSDANVGTNKTLTPVGSVSDGNSGNNYSITFSPVATGVINAATLTYTANSASRTYGAANPAFSGAVTGFIGANNQANSTTGTLTFGSTANAASSVGSYAINGSGLSATNYIFVQAAGNATALSITPATLTITANDANKTYGNAITPAGTEFHSVGLQNSQTIGAVTLTSGGYTAGASVAGSPYVIAPSAATGGTFTASNYAISYQNGSLTVSPKDIDVTADAQTKVFGDSDPALTYTHDPLVGSDAFTGALTRARGEDVGSYAISQNTLSAGGNYTIHFTGANLVISQAASQTVISCPASVVYTGSVQEPCTAAVTGIGGLNTTATVTYGNNTNVGTATADATYPGDTNHASSVATQKTFAITKADSSTIITCPSTPTTYTGAAIEPCTAAVTGVGGLSTTATVTYSANIHAGTATAHASYGGDANHNSSIATDATFTIAKADPDCSTIAGYSTSYDGASHTATGSCVGVGTDSTLAGLDLSATAHSNAGDYPTDPWTFTAVSGDYNNAAGTVHDSIGKADAICSVSGYTGIYDAGAHGATGSCHGVESPTPVDLSTALDLGATFTDFPGGTAHWTYTDTSGNYNNTAGDAAIVVNKATAVISVTPYSVTYNGDPHTASGSATGVGGADLSADIDLSGTTHTAAGTYATDAWTFNGGTNYNNDAGTLSDSIGKANAVIVVTPYAVTYDGSAHTAAGSATGAKGESLTGLDVSGTTHTNASTYGTDPWTFTDSTGNYNDDAGNVSDSIAKADATCTISGSSSTYDAQPHAATGSCAGVGTDLTPTGLSLGASFTNSPGDTAHWTFSNPNYNDQAGDAAITINAKDVNVVVDAGQGKVYGASDTALTSTNDPLIGTDAYTGNLHRASGEAVGSYAIDQGTLTAGSNYTIHFTGANFVITPATLTVTADPQTKVYGAGDPPLTFAASGFQFSDNVGSVLTGSLSRDAGESVGSYPITQGTLASNSNYLISFTGSNLSVTPATLDITANNDTKVYGDAKTYLGTEFTPVGLQNSETIGSVSLSSTGDGAAAGVNTYPIVASAATGGTFTASNYDIHYHDGTLTVGKKAADVSANHKDKTFGVNNPTLDATVIGTVNGDLLNYTLDTTASQFSPVGDYPITVTSGSNPNYDVTTHDNTLTISKADQTITVSPHAPATAVYNSHFTVGATSDSSLPVTVTTTGVCTNAGNDVTTTSGTGDCVVHYNQGGNDNYSSAPEITETIHASKAAPDCTIHGFSGAYDGDAHAATGTCTGVGGPSDSLSGLDLGGAFTNVPGGIAHWSYSGDDNYNASSSDAAITITKATPTISVTHYDAIYDGNPHTATGTATGVKEESLTGLDLSGTTHTNAGDYPSDPWTFTDITGNYSNANSTVHDVIGQADQTITFAALTDKHFGDADFTVSATASSNLDVSFSSQTGTVCSVSGNTVHIETVGSCTVRASQAGDSNFNAAPNVDQSFGITDNTPPVIHDTPAATSTEATSALGAVVSYTNPTATDDVDGTDTVTCVPASGATFPIGNTTVNCNAQDTAGNPATQTSFVVQVEDTTAPVITMLGTSPVSVERLASYVDAGATANDTVDGNLTSSIVPTSDVDASTVGTYHVHYNVKDAHNNTAVEVTREVDVVDTTPPSAPVIDTKPVDPTNSTSANFTFHDSEVGVTFKCQLDGGAEALCTSPFSQAVTEGPHTFSVQAFDASNNGSDAATYTWHVDTTGPTILITAPTTGSTTGSSGSITYNSGDSATVLCTLDGSAIPCTTAGPVPFGPLASGSHTFSITGTDAVGNPSVASVVWTVDATPPVITLVGSTPANVEIGTTYTDAGATASDNTDGNDTASIVTTSDVNTAVIGTYHIHYNITDTHGNAATEVVRTVNVTDHPAPIITAQSASTATTNSIVITWTTDHPATSRVVYDTVTHPTPGTSPNYSYANSTTEDPTLATSHSVTVTGLSPGTTYFFRAVSHGSPEAISPEITLATSKLSQTITFASLLNKAFGDADFTVSASASSGLAATFAAAGQCSISTNIVHLLGTGSCTITAKQAGNATYDAAPDVARTFTIAPKYTFGGFLDPINNPGHGETPSVFKAGSTVPIKFQLLKNGVSVQATALPQFSSAKGLALSATVDESVVSDPGTTGTTFKWDGSQYAYNWKTDKSQAGFWYLVRVTLDDGSVQTVTIGLK